MSGIKTDPQNLRLHDERNRHAIRESLEQLGAGRSVVVDRENILVAGNGVWAEAEALGIPHEIVETDGSKLIVIKRTDLSPDDPRRTKLAIADNRTSDLSVFDEDALAEVLDSLPELDGTGFDNEDLALLFADEPAEGLTDPDEIPEPPDDPITQPGDLWLLGEHRVLCGDATNAEDVERVMGGEQPSAVVTDPPYGIGFEYESHDDDREKWFGLMGAVVPMMRHRAPFVVMPCCGIDRMGWWYANHAPDWLLAWYKGSPGHRSHVGFNDWEALLVWGKPPKQMHDYFQTACGFKDADGHPCPKPVAWALWLVKRAVELGKTTFDPFLGSGTTLIACEQLGRKCYGIEIEPRYVDVIVKRWEDFTGKEAERVAG